MRDPTTPLAQSCHISLDEDSLFLLLLLPLLTTLCCHLSLSLTGGRNRCLDHSIPDILLGILVAQTARIIAQDQLDNWQMTKDHKMRQRGKLCPKGNQLANKERERREKTQLPYYRPDRVSSDAAAACRIP